jgi:hypothetical protein
MSTRSLRAPHCVDMIMELAIMPARTGAGSTRSAICRHGVDTISDLPARHRHHDERRDHVGVMPVRVTQGR